MLKLKSVKSRLLISTLWLLLGAVSLVGQSIVTKSEMDNKWQKKYAEAVKLSRSADLKKALKKMDKVIDKYPTFVEAHLKRSGILYNMGDYDGSIAAIDDAIALDPDGDPEMYYSKGFIQREQRKYGAAAQSFQIYLQKAEKGERYDKAKILQQQTAFADYATKNPVPYDPQKLPGAINSNMSEYIPALTVDGEQMIFTRRVNGQEDLYIATLKDGSFENIKELTEINTPQNEGVHTISADGNRIIFTACNRRKEGMGGCDLFTSYMTDEGWSIPRNMGPVINTATWEAQPSLTSDGRQLFWSSNRLHGAGGNDIWTSTRTDTSGWNTPEPLSASINTEHNEESPFIHPDGKTLYFRSNRPVGMGDFDIYYARYNDTTRTWMPAVNIGYPINTEGAEGALSVSLDGNMAYFATDQNTGMDGNPKNLDIYQFELYHEARPQAVTFIKARITDSETGEPIAASIEIVNLDNDVISTTGKANSNGYYLSSLLAGYKYGFFVSAPGYVYSSDQFDLQEIKTSYDPYVLQIQLRKSIEVVANTDTVEKTPVILKNIFFETGSSLLDGRSSAEIDRLVKNLKENPDLRIQIAGHTDNVGSDAANKKLSEDRAKAVVDAISAKGINRDRLSYVGYGESQPIDTNETEIGRQNNRRTTFKILK